MTVSFAKNPAKTLLLETSDTKTSNNIIGKYINIKIMILQNKIYK